MIFTFKRLREALDYDSESGVMTWRNRPDVCLTWNSRFAGKVAGSTDYRGYTVIVIDCKKYLLHRLAWLWMTGMWPTCEIDHKDCDASNNAWTNLREATRSQNQGNTRKGRRNKSGVKGVSWNSHRGKWEVQLKVGPVTMRKCCASLEEAARVYRTEAEKYHGEFARAT